MPRSINKSEDLLLSAPDSKSGRLQRECLKLLREHERNGDIPTNGRSRSTNLSSAVSSPRSTTA